MVIYIGKQWWWAKDLKQSYTELQSQSTRQLGRKEPEIRKHQETNSIPHIPSRCFVSFFGPVILKTTDLVHIDIKVRFNYTKTHCIWTVDRVLYLFYQWHAAIVHTNTEFKLVRDLLRVKLSWLWKAGRGDETYLLLM